MPSVTMPTVVTLQLFCRGPGEAAWSRLNTAQWGAETHPDDRERSRVAAERYIALAREKWAGTHLFRDHDFKITEDDRWPR